MHGQAVSLVGSFSGICQAVRKARPVIDVGGEPCVQGQRRSESSIERIALVVVNRCVVRAEVAGRIGADGAGEATDNVSALLGDLIGVTQVELAEPRQLR